ncbi:AlkZ family DNA glycosylase [Ktedonobacteria bacterium brp13]|nr:AlkZ family DNA glycosylase [Ktedonobacteria bacterium brp13]
MAERILTLRELNRAILVRQCLVERTSRPALAVIKHLVALQGQVSNAPYIGMWTRLHSFQRAELTTLLESRQAVRASSLRGTLHIMTAEDYLLIHPLLQSVLNRNFMLFARQAKDFDMDRFIIAIRAYIQEQPRTNIELRTKMEELYPGMGKAQIFDAVRMHMALIQALPAGTWGFTGRPTHIEATAWLGRPLANQADGRQQLIRRYLAAFGPASTKDIQAWSGLTGLQRTIEALRPELRTYRDEQGRELFDLPDAPLPPVDIAVPVRFLPAYDNLVLGLADRKRVLPDAYRTAIFTGNGMHPTFLVDGFVRGRWRVERTTPSATLVIEPFEPLTHQIRTELQEEGKRLMHWISQDTEQSEILFNALE